LRTCTLFAAEQHTHDASQHDQALLYLHVVLLSLGAETKEAAGYPSEFAEQAPGS
jgi:hypothetical protein